MKFSDYFETMRNVKYVLDGERPVAEPDIEIWAKWFESSARARQVRKDEIDGCIVSTIFLGIDHGLDPKIPVLWETRIFGGTLNGDTKRCGGAWEQAEAMHESVLDTVRGIKEL